jgi:programmed cell death 8 (apoptosis-inducing factor)
MNFLKSAGRSARFAQRRANLSHFKGSQGYRLYSSTTPIKQEGSNVPWVIGSLFVFGPLLFKLTSPPPPKKKQVIEHTPVPVNKEEPEAVVEEQSVKSIPKPYVLIGAGTASFAAAQAIKEKDPEANVKNTLINFFSVINVSCLGYYYWRRRLCSLYAVKKIKRYHVIARKLR